MRCSFLRNEFSAVKLMNERHRNTAYLFSSNTLGEPSPPSIHGQPGSGKSFKLSIIKQDDGGAPILEYIVKYRSVSM